MAEEFVWSEQGLNVRTFHETADTCPYWTYGPVYKMRTVIWGCGGYGEVAPNHPAAGGIICAGPEHLCKRCGGTGMVMFGNPLMQHMG